MEFNKQNKQAKGKEDKPRSRLLTVENTRMVTRREACGGTGEIGDRDSEYTYHVENKIKYNNF